MITPNRLRIGAAVGSIALLGGAWLLTTGDDPDTGLAAATTTTSTTAAPPTTVAPPETTAPPAAPPGWRGLTFTDVTEAAGLDEPQAASTPIGADGQTGGAAVADVDDDGDLDVFLTRIGLPNRLMLNDGTGTFTDGAEAAGVAGRDPDQGSAAAVWADVDGDGHLDLYLTGAGRGGSELLRNDGTGTFTDVTATAGLDDLAGDGLAGTASFGAAFDDWDHDGDLDLITLQWYKAPFERQLQAIDVTSAQPDALEPCSLAAERREGPLPEGLPGSRSRLYENDGTGTFTDVTAASGIDVERLIGFQPAFADVDGDGWNDLLVTGDYCTSRLFRNDEGRGWRDITDEAGVGTDQNGMGSVVADLDGDGNLDWFVSSIAASGVSECLPDDPCSRAGNRLYLGDGTGTFADATDTFGVRSGSWGWGAAAADLDLDGHLDLALANGVRFQSAGSDPTLRNGDDSDEDPSAVWMDDGTGGPWPEVAQDIGITDRTNGKALVAFDADGDGDLDLLFATTETAPLLYRNDIESGPDAHWLQLRLRAPGTSNPFAIGARVRVLVGDGSPARPLEVRAGGSFQSSDPTDLHLGLGSVATVERVEVWWPGETAPQVIDDVASDQVLEIVKP